MIAAKKHYLINAEFSGEKKGRDNKRRIKVRVLFINFIFRIYISPFNAIISDFELFRVLKISLIY